MGGDEELPMGEEFQEHLKRFVKPNEKKVQKRIELIQKIVSQLAYVHTELSRDLTRACGYSIFYVFFLCQRQRS